MLMRSQNVSAEADEVIKHLTFLIRFATSPGETVATYASPESISAALFLLMSAGIAVAILVVSMFRKMGWQTDPELTEETFGPLVAGFFAARFGPVRMALGALIMLFVAATAIHLGAFLWSVTVGAVGLSPAHLGGSAVNSVNAALAFAAFLFPISALIMVVIGSLVRVIPGLRPGLSLLGAIVIGLIVMVYYPLALSGAHPGTSFEQAFAAFTGGLLAVGILGMVAAGSVRWLSARLTSTSEKEDEG